MARSERSPSGLMLRRRAATHVDIALAAATLFDEQGYDATTVEQIATASGLSLRTFYRYCSTKDDVFTSVLIGGFARLVDAVAAASSDWSYADMADLAVDVMSEASPDMDLMKRLTTVALEAPALQARWIVAGREAQDELAALFVQKLGKDRLTSLTLAALTMTAMSTGIEFALTEGTPLRETLKKALAQVTAAAT